MSTNEMVFEEIMARLFPNKPVGSRCDALAIHEEGKEPKLPEVDWTFFGSEELQSSVNSLVLACCAIFNEYASYCRLIGAEEAALTLIDTANDIVACQLGDAMLQRLSAAAQQVQPFDHELSSILWKLSSQGVIIPLAQSCENTNKEAKVVKTTTDHRLNSDLFLKGLRKGLSVSRAAEKANGTRAGFYALKNRDQGFAESWEDALEEGTDILEDIAYKFAKRGDSSLIKFLLCARRSEKYRERRDVNLSGTICFAEILEQLDDPDEMQEA
ncbi:hypothetical protein GCM10011332_32730 [Terasakiella brassicae]|uniref:Uncharacterized protein n=1 Tax=Terasakiella brassicae TaxID=1634917 RepID=A0A917C8T6_9PROT|nr:hypothetical protein [Terasakiella brassicae]GGF76230.1 hypothetical protein GCM10011332_32730 [Terasakiella brassicae]